MRDHNVMESPSVSVILPTYNRAALLARAVNSVLNQSFRDLELIVIDDCSSDHTQDELAKIADPRLRVIRQTINSGASAARNVGIRASSGRFIAFQDSDDEWSPEKLKKQMALLEMERVGTYPGACYSRYIVAEGEKTVVIPSDPSASLAGDIYARLLHSNTMGTPVMVVRKEVLDKVGYFDESLANLEDWDLALRISNCCTVAFLDEVTLISYSTPASVNKMVRPESLIIILQKHWDSYRSHPAALARILWQTGSQFAKLHERAEALSYMNRSLSHYFDAGRYLLFVSLRVGPTPYNIVLSCLRRIRSVVARMQNGTALSIRTSAGHQISFRSDSMKIGQ